MERDTFTADDVHRAFHWIAGTTLFNRVKKGLCPTKFKPRGTGVAFKFSMAGLVHVGVVDELLALGAWKDVDRSSQGMGPLIMDSDIRFLPAKDDKREYDRAKSKIIGGDRKLLARKNREALLFYEFYQFDCKILVELVHTQVPALSGDELAIKRRKRSFRYSRVYFFSSCPNSRYEPTIDDYLAGRVHIVDIREGVGADCWSRAILDVNKIYYDVRHRLGLLRELHERIDESISEISQKYRKDIDKVLSRSSKRNRPQTASVE